MSWSQASHCPASQPHPLLSSGCLSPPQSSILDLVDIFTPAPALPSTHSAGPWDIPGGHGLARECFLVLPQGPAGSPSLTAEPCGFLSDILLGVGAAERFCSLKVSSLDALSGSAPLSERERERGCQGCLMPGVPLLG